MLGNDYSIDNSGRNEGVIVAQNNGSIDISIQKAVKIPSLISTIVKSLGDVCSYDEGRPTVPQEFKPDEKIEYNSVIKYKEIINNFAAFYNTCENYLNAYDDSNIRGKAKILNCVHLWYMNAKGDVLLENKDIGKGDIEIVRENSDRLIDMVRDKIFETVTSSTIVEVMYIEDMNLGITCFTCFCFMKCKILEKPI